ncbi:hypothetical protein Bbelb_187110 [Branchiostoma belcheri]|nr:hypothetical protein Bbelb_187110 [Branchiostoma belcheri]
MASVAAPLIDLLKNQPNRVTWTTQCAIWVPHDHRGRFPGAREGDTNVHLPREGELVIRAQFPEDPIHLYDGRVDSQASAYRVDVVDLATTTWPSYMPLPAGEPSRVIWHRWTRASRPVRTTGEWHAIPPRTNVETYVSEKVTDEDSSSCNAGLQEVMMEEAGKSQLSWTRFTLEEGVEAFYGGQQCPIH